MKNNKNFLIVFPKYVNKGQPYDFNYGIAIISAVLKEKGYNVYCLNPNHSDEQIKKQLSNVILLKEIDVVCTGGMSPHCEEIKRILDESKEINPSILTVVGGAIVTSIPEVVLEHMKADYGVIGEGEETIVELADAIIYKKELDKIKGIAYVKDNKFIKTEERPPIKDLDKIPIPDYDGFEYEEYIKLFYPNDIYWTTVLDEVRIGTILSSRSCPFLCTFCYHPLGNKYRQRSLDSVFKELDYLVQRYNINYLNVMDELFAYDKERMYEFADRIKKYNIKWWAQLRVTDVNQEILRTLKDSGLFMISYGIESISDKILTSMKKYTTKAQIENALKLTYEAKINILGNILIGFPEDTKETIKESVDWLKAHPEYGINLIMVRTLPNSPIYQYALSKGLIKDEYEYMVNKIPYVNLTKMTDKEYQQISIYVNNYVYENCNEKDTKHHYFSGKILNSKVTRITSRNEILFTTEVECPSCSSQMEYKNMYQRSFKTYFMVICRNCGVHLKLESIEVFKENYKTQDKIMNSIVKYLQGNVNKKFIIGYIYYVINYLRYKNLLPSFLLTRIK